MKNYIFWGLISYQYVIASNNCDPGLLDIPENGKAWNFNQNNRKWELECELNYIIEKVSVRDFHRCKSNGQWASPLKVVVKCEFSSKAIYDEIEKLGNIEEQLTEMIDDVSEMTEQLSENLSVSNLTNEILCNYYDCSGFKPKHDVEIIIDGPISISENNKVGEINGYFDNYQFSFVVKANQLTAITDLSIQVGQAKADNNQSLIYLFHGLYSNQYRIWFTFFGSGSFNSIPSFQRYDEWHKFQFIQSTSDGINCVQQLKLNGEQIWDNQLSCPAPLQGGQGIWMTGDDSRVLDGEIKNFKFFTYDL